VLTIKVDSEEVNGEIRFTAEVKEMKGCFSEGSSLQDVLINIYDAIEVWNDGTCRDC
jgi:predicted RNase H-like HicB family nuclease